MPTHTARRAGATPRGTDRVSDSRMARRLSECETGLLEGWLYVVSALSKFVYCVTNSYALFYGRFSRVGAGSTGGASAGPGAVGGTAANASAGNMWSLVSGLARASAPAVSTGTQQAGEGEAGASSGSSMFRIFSGLPSTNGGGGTLSGSRSASPADGLLKLRSPREAEAAKPHDGVGAADQAAIDATSPRGLCYTTPCECGCVISF